MNYRIVDDENEKSQIAEAILTKLPEWFGNETALTDYVKGVCNKVFYGAFNEGQAVGFLSIQHNNPYTADLYVTGVLKAYHRMGIGKHLLNMAEEDLIKAGYRFFMVKTLDASAQYTFYDQTRAFYLGMGFYPLAVFPEIWDEENPCLIMVKALERQSDENRI